MADYEKFVAHPYYDKDAKHQPLTAWVKNATVGYGHIIQFTEWEKFCNGITEQEARKLKEADLVRFNQVVRESIKVEISQQQFDALVILAYNIGADGFRKSSVVKLINDPAAKTEYTSFDEAWLAWKFQDHKVIEGLVKRRKSELRLFKEGVYRREN